MGFSPSELMRPRASALQWVSANATSLSRSPAAKQPAKIAAVGLSMLRRSRRIAFIGRLSSSISSPSITTTMSFSAALLHVWSPSSQLVNRPMVMLSSTKMPRLRCLRRIVARIASTCCSSRSAGSLTPISARISRAIASSSRSRIGT